jgi:hypothetical protein
LIKYVSNNPERGSVSEAFVDRLTMRFPLRSVSAYRNLYLFLDTVGNVRIINQSSGEIIYNGLFSGVQDAVFINDTNIMLGSSTGAGNSPFLMVNIRTGETVPIPLSVDVGTKVYRGESGFVYGAAISRNGNNLRTSLLYINTSNPARSYSLFDLESEDTLMAIAESTPFLASTISTGGASIFRIPGINSSVSYSSSSTALERNAGLHQKIISGNGCFICLDSDGNITWHDPGTGRILAHFRIYADAWVLEAQGVTTRGRIQ